MSKQKLIIIFLALALYLISTGITYSLFVNKVGSTGSQDTSSSDVATDTGAQGNDYEALEFDKTEPKTETCPLTGVKYSKKQKEWWEQHRPLGVMIENHPDARPQSGLSFADTVYEAIAEGGITRFLTIFYCQDAGYVGPVRSARTYFVDFISEYGEFPLYAHVGGANTPGPADALGQIRKYGWKFYNDLDQFAISFPTYQSIGDRNGRDVALEHTQYAITTKLWEVAKEREITEVDKDGNVWDADFVFYKFKKDASLADRPAKQSVYIEYWEDYKTWAVKWIYNKESNVYLRENGGETHLDRNTNKQLSAKNVVILYMIESNANDGYENNLHLLYKNKGTGKALIFIDGKQIKGTWRKDSRTERTMLYDSSGEEIEFNPGNIWFHIVPLEGVVEIE